MPHSFLSDATRRSLSMTVNPFPLPAKCRVQKPLLYFTTSTFTHIPFSNSCTSYVRRKFTRYAAHCSCCGVAVTANSCPPVTVLDDSCILLFSLFQGMGFNEKETEAILDSNEALRLSTFDSIRSRIRLLQSVGMQGSSLSRLIVKRPGVLTAPEVDGLLCFFVGDFFLELKGKIEEPQIERLLTATEPGLLLGFERKVRLLLEYGIPKEQLLLILNTVNLNKALCLKSFEEMEGMLAFLQRFGGAKLILQRPAILNYDLEAHLIPRIGLLMQLYGNDEEATGSVLCKFPFILAYTVDHLRNHVEFLHSYAGLSYEEISKIVLIYPCLFSASKKRKLHPRIEFLKQCELDSQDIFRFFIKAPLFLSLSLEGNLANKLVLLVKLGYENRTKQLAMALGAVTRCSCKNLQGVIGVYLNYGLSCEDILEMSKRHPQVLQYNHVSLEKKLVYLIEEMGREVGEVLSFPAYLGYKLDGRIKQRFKEKRKTLGEGMFINKLLSVSVATFLAKGKKKRPV